MRNRLKRDKGEIRLLYKSGAALDVRNILDSRWRPTGRLIISAVYVDVIRFLKLEKGKSGSQSE